MPWSRPIIPTVSKSNLMIRSLRWWWWQPAITAGTSLPSYQKVSSSNRVEKRSLDNYDHNYEIWMT
jgi:hypothetical protein